MSEIITVSQREVYNRPAEGANGYRQAVKRIAGYH